MKKRPLLSFCWKYKRKKNPPEHKEIVQITFLNVFEQSGDLLVEKKEYFWSSGNFNGKMT